MRFSPKILAAAAALSMAAVAPATVVLAQTPTPPPASAWAREAAMASVTLSPDGQHMAAIISPDGRQRAIAIWDLNNLNAEPFLVGTDARSEFISVQFVKNDRLFVRTQQLSEYNPFSGSPEQTYRYRTQMIDMEGNAIRTPQWDGLNERQQAYVGFGQLLSTLPQDPTDILVQGPRGDVYRLNTSTGAISRAERGSDRFQSVVADLNGEIRGREEFILEGGQAYFGIQLKDPTTGQWAEHFRWSARDREPVSIVGFTNDPNTVLIQSTQGRDHAAIYEYNISTRQLGEPAFAHPFFDATGVIRSRDPAHYGEILGFSYGAERGRVYWLDSNLEQAEATLRAALGVQTESVSWVDIASGQRGRFTTGDGADIEITSWSNDLSEMVVVKSGPSQPPEYYLIQNGRARLLGRAYPEMDLSALGETHLIQYAARDGLMIPAFLTTPNPAIFGNGPYPTIVTPHGGPWARDDLDWDSTGWTQYFASRGYVVLQPQYRGSEGWGQRLWRAGDSEWGGRMQDDKDDGVRYLIERGIADPNRVAMHGYSYGGYAAMVAAVRPNGLYQCAVAGAGPSSLNDIRQDTYNNRFIREFQHPHLNGMSPIDHISEISIPIYLYTGDRDTRVEPAESERLYAALRNAGKPVTLRILPDMEHTGNTWTPANIEAVLTSVESYLRTECGPGGL
ncbi:alpha/beta hydrolase family protein [Brevundimonas aveniformis]|uniref:alpha/beta hydrolase family protein n=1 Tax=Brevundimonas aveniformis TaxID=370977 RepID=UPI0004172666|nr:prolyl oligopeptidase family serine peptidase [Brevundimonas aveniformis]